MRSGVQVAGDRVVSRFGSACVLLACASVAAHAQVVRGTVREAGSGRPLAGVVVSLHESGATRASSDISLATLTGNDGTFAVRAVAGRRYVVSAKRIGVLRYSSEPLSLADGESRQLDITLEPLRYELPRVAVSATTACRGDQRDAERERVAALWEEARTALTASQLALRDRLFRATITTYERALSPYSLGVESENRTVRNAVTEHAFVSVPAETLAVRGYVTEPADGMYEVYAPDERVLLSDHFVRDHCFRLAPPNGDSLVGIAFEPVRGRRQRDIRGTIWLDARSFELRRLAYRYTSLPVPVPERDTLTGGEVRFARLGNGVWYVSSWFIRTPRVVEQAAPLEVTRSTPRVQQTRPAIVGYRMEGGNVIPEDPTRERVVSQLSGRVLDSAGTRGLDGAIVRVAGTPFEAEVSGDGRFRFDSLPGGETTLLVDHPSYSLLGLLAAEQRLDVPVGGRTTTQVRGVGSDQLVRMFCEGSRLPDRKVAVRFVLVDSATGERLAGRELVVSWDDRRVVGPGLVKTTSLGGELTTDERGGVSLCDLPPDAPVVIESFDASGGERREWRVRTPEKGFAVVPLRR